MILQIYYPSPVENLLGIFKKYVYTKNTVDPAPRLIQECKYHNKEIIYEASNTGAEVYKNRNIKKPDVECIINELWRLGSRLSWK